jgi:hypothetical protein
MSATSKPRGSDDEILLLISIRRQSAWESMRQIVEGFGEPPHRIPSIAALNNYLTNMVFCIELMLKLLSGNWRSHDVGAMFQAVFGAAPPSPQLMSDIKSAIMDQKYLFEPAAGLDANVPELERLYSTILKRLKTSFPDFSISKTVSLPLSFAEYIRDNAERFCRKESETFGPDNPPPADFWEKHVAESHRQLQQVRQAFREHASNHSTFDFETRIESLT